MRKEFDITKSIEIGAGIDDCYAMILDFKRYDEWCPFVRGVSIIAVEEETGVPLRAAYNLQIVLPKMIRLVLEYGYDREKYRLDYRACGGDVTDADGHYQYRALKPDRTLLVFNVRINFGIVLPPKISNYLIDRVMLEFLESIKAGCEKPAK